MNSREKVQAIFNRTNTGKPAFWTGNPKEESLHNYAVELGFIDDDDKLGYSTEILDYTDETRINTFVISEKLYRYLDDDCRWIMADAFSYRHPENKPVFDVMGGVKKLSHAQPGCFAECTSIKEVEDYDWPNTDYLVFDHLYKIIDTLQDKMLFTGMWSPFFHIVADFFGMENYFVKMYTDPGVVEAVTNHVVDFCVKANEIFFEGLGDRADVMFFGNDFGTQLDLLISPEKFNEFVLPGFKKLIETGKKYNKKILLHSCGAINKVIPTLIDAGIDGLHPLQAMAADMDAVNLASQFKNDICFVGGVDTQDLLVHATPEQVREEVLRLRDIFGPNFVISPSHEAILPNVSLDNVIAMARAAKE